jgi:prefoldin subunit 5
MTIEANLEKVWDRIEQLQADLTEANNLIEELKAYNKKSKKKQKNCCGK